jgi:hypothetical protein
MQAQNGADGNKWLLADALDCRERGCCGALGRVLSKLCSAQRSGKERAIGEGNSLQDRSGTTANIS